MHTGAIERGLGGLTLALLLALTGCVDPADRIDVPEEHAARAAASDLDRVFDASFAWWGQVYDASSGACFYGLSARQASAIDPRFGPDIESTQKLVAVLEWTGLLDASPDSFRRGVVGYLRGRQEADSGFFRDPQHAGSYNPNSLQRATGMAAGTLRRCGAKPRFPLPGERVGQNADAAEHFAFLASPESLRGWLRDLPWDGAVWTAGARLRTHAGTFRELEASRREALLDAVERFVADRQRPDGFFGGDGDAWYSRLSGTYKVAAFLDMNGRTIPRRAEMAATLRGHLQDREYRNTIVLYNTVNLLHILQRNGVAFAAPERVALVGRCTDVLRTLRGPDGGFVTQRDVPSPTSNGRLLGREIVESDTNATGLAHKTRGLLIEFLTGRPFPHPHPRGVVLLEALGAGGTAATR